MRPRERTSKRIGLGTVPALTRAEHGGDEAGSELDAANDMVFRIGHIQLAARIGEPFGTCELRQAGRPAIARIALLAGTRQMMNRPGFRGDAVNRITFAKREIDVAFTIERQRPGPVQRRTLSPAHHQASAAVRRCHRRSRSCRWKYLPVECGGCRYRR